MDTEERVSLRVGRTVPSEPIERGPPGEARPTFDLIRLLLGG